MDELRKVKVTERHSGDEFVGKFHHWFTKVFEGGSSYLYAVIEDQYGDVQCYDLDSSSIQFLPTDNINNH